MSHKKNEKKGNLFIIYYTFNKICEKNKIL